MKKVIKVLLIALLLCSCTSQKTEQNIDDKVDAKLYLEKLENYVVKQKNINNTVDDVEFDEFLNSIFVDMMSENYLSMHYSVKDYKALGISKPEVKLGDIEYAYPKEDVDLMLEQLDQLLSFDYDKLSYKQQYYYDELEYSIYETLCDLYFYQYSYLFNSGNNLIDNIYTSLSDFTFYNKESVDDYIVLLQDVDRYLNDCLTYTKAQYDDGIYMLDAWIEYTKQTCDDFINNSDSLTNSFKDNIADLDFLSDEQKNSYSQEVNEIVNSEIVDAVSLIKEEMNNFVKTASYDDLRLSNISKDYAKTTYYLAASNNESIDVLFEKLYYYLYELEDNFVKVLQSNKGQYVIDLIDNPSGAFALSPKDTLEYLRNNLGKYYPDLGDVSYSIDYLDPNTASATTSAYYWQAPVDDYNQNVIKVNPAFNSYGINAYGTVAHEGFPGHLYQAVYYLKTNPSNFYRTIGFIGYSEGYAVMASKDAYDFVVEDSAIADFLFYYNYSYFLTYSIIDIGVNYYGWKTKDVMKFFNDDPYGIYNYFDEEMAESYLEFLIEYSGTYVSYGAGLVNMLELRDYGKSQLGDKFDIVEYNRSIIENGALPYNMLKVKIDEYISELK